MRVDFEPLDKNFVSHVSYFETIFNFFNGSYLIRFNFDGLKRYSLTANKDGFSEIEDPENQFVVLKTVSHPYGYTGATVGVASTIVALVGLILVLTLLILHKNEKIKLPGL